MAEFDLVNDFDEFQITTLKDVPKHIEREYMKTKSIKDVATEISFKRITTKVQDYEIKKGGLMKADYVIFQVVSDEPGKLYKMRTYRTDEDFYDLRRLMVIALPYIMVPPLPVKSLKT
jgi:hypothetical protein